jgi:hypothetical protein
MKRGYNKMESTASLELQNSEVTRPNKRKASSRPRQNRPYKSVSGASLETRIADLKNKVIVLESKAQVLRDKLKQHNDELAMRETQSAAA